MFIVNIKYLSSALINLSNHEYQKNYEKIPLAWLSLYSIEDDTFEETFL